jgi:hypothetical protein
MADWKTVLQPASVLGIGAMTPLGRDLAEIARKLEEPPDAAAQAFRVSDEMLTDASLSRNLRRADRFTRMAVMAAVDAWKAAGPACADVPVERVGMILSSGLGPHCRGFKFLDGLIDAGDSAASPTDFSHSVHGAACAYISGLLGVRGPSLTMTDFEIGFEEAVRLAQCWLGEGACDRVLIGAVEEIGEVLLYCAARMLDETQRIVPGEGAMFMVLGPSDVGGGIARISGTAEAGKVDLLIIQPEVVPVAGGQAAGTEARETVTYSSHFGASASSPAFGVLGGLLALGRMRNGRSIDNAATLRTRSDGRAATLLLERIPV